MPIRSSRKISRMKYTIKAVETFPRKTSLFGFRSFTEISILQKTHELESNSDETWRRHMLAKNVQMAAREIPGPPPPLRAQLEGLRTQKPQDLPSATEVEHSWETEGVCP